VALLHGPGNQPAVELLPEPHFGSRVRESQEDQAWGTKPSLWPPFQHSWGSWGEEQAWGWG
jgi:hypothetical protein